MIADYSLDLDEVHKFHIENRNEKGYNHLYKIAPSEIIKLQQTILRLAIEQKRLEIERARTPETQDLDKPNEKFDQRIEDLIKANEEINKKENIKPPESVINPPISNV